jgi:hypothetical protein
MKPIHKKRIDDFIDECLNEFLFEQNDEEDTLGTMTNFIDSEEKKTKASIESDNKMKSAQIDPMERAIKEKQIRINKDKMIQLNKLRDELNKSMEAKKKAEEQKAKEAKASASIEVTAEAESAPIFTRQFAEQAPVPTSTPVQLPAQTTQPQQKKTVVVTFESNTDHPFKVKFTERGFLVGNTRLSFEIIETSLSKNFDIILDGGKGFALTQVRMQKILKYKDAV